MDSEEKTYKDLYRRGDLLGCLAIAKRLGLTDAELLLWHRDAMKVHRNRGNVRKYEYRWYTNGHREGYYRPKYSPKSWKRGRRYRGVFSDRSGPMNPAAKPVIVYRNGCQKRYDHLKAVCKDFPEVSYGYLKRIAQRNKYREFTSTKWNLRIEYVET